MANILENADFALNAGSAETPLWWVSNATYEPVFCIGGELGVEVIAPGQLRVALGTATQVDPTIAYPGVIYTGEGFNTGAGDIWEFSFDYAIHAPYNIGGGYTGVVDPGIFVRIGGVFLDLTTDSYVVYFANLPLAGLATDFPDVVFPYDELFQIPADWPTGRYQFAICARGASEPIHSVGLTYDIFSPSVDLISGGAPPGSGPPDTESWVFVALGSDFPGNHPDYDQLVTDRITGVLWKDDDPNIVAGMASTRAAGLAAGVWSVGDDYPVATDFANHCSTLVTTYAPDLLVMDNEFVAKGYDPTDVLYFDPLYPTGWQWNEDLMAAYRVLQPTQATDVTTLPVQTDHADFNFAAYTSRGARIWPQSYGATIGVDDIDPVLTFNHTVANGVARDDIKVVLPFDVWGADLVELHQIGVYTFVVFTAEGMQAAGGGTPPDPPPPGINGLGGVPSGYAFYPRPRMIPGYPIPGGATGNKVNLEWDAWQFTPPFPPSTYPTIGPLPHVGGQFFLTTGLYFEGYWYADCGIAGNPGDFPSGYFFEGAVLGSALRYFYIDGSSALSDTCGGHYFALIISDFVLVPDREYQTGPSAWSFQPGFHLKMAHSSAAPFFTSDAVSPPRPIDELRGGAFRYDIAPYEPLYRNADTTTTPDCGGTLSDVVVGGPHAGSYRWKLRVLKHGGGNPSPGDCEIVQARLLNPPVGGIPGDFATWTDAWHDLFDFPDFGFIVGDNLYLPPTPLRCYIVEIREVCDGIIGPTVRCGVCIPNAAGEPILDIEYRAESD